MTAIDRVDRSMDKLFDLMMMGFKYQLLCSTRLEGILQVRPAQQGWSSGWRSWPAGPVEVLERLNRRAQAGGGEGGVVGVGGDDLTWPAHAACTAPRACRSPSCT